MAQPIRAMTPNDRVPTNSSILSLPWAWLGTLYAIPLLWLLLIGWILGLFAAIGVLSKRHTGRQIETEVRYDQHGTRKNPSTTRKSHRRSLTAVLAVALIVLAISGMTAFLVPPTTSNPGQGNGHGGQGNGAGGSLAGLSTPLTQVDQISDPKGLGYDGQRKMAVDTTGNIYLAYRKAAPGHSESEIYVEVSQD